MSNNLKVFIMQNAFEFAEMVNQANYAALSYSELVTLNFAYLLALGDIKPLIQKKRAEEMDAITDEYVAKMNNYGASKDEILSCIEKKQMRKAPYAPIESQDVDDQTPTMDVDDQAPTRGVDENQDKGESVLALPEPSLTTRAEIMETEPAEESKDEGQNKDLAINRTSEGDAQKDDSEPLRSEVASLNGPADADTTTPTLLLDAVMEIAKKGRIPDEIDVNAPYFVDYIINHDDNGKLWRKSKCGRNLDKKDLEEFRAAAEKHQKFFRKKEIMMSTDDCLIFRENTNAIHVFLYHFPEKEIDGSGNQGVNCTSYSNNIPYYASVDIHKTHRRMLRAIEKAKEYSASIGSSNSPYYDRYVFHDNNVSTKLTDGPERITEDERTISEIMISFETYARFLDTGMVVVSKDNCVAVKANDTIYVVLFNISSKKKEKTARRKSEHAIKNVAKQEKIESGTGLSSAQGDVKTPILNAVDMTKTLPLENEAGDSAPFFVQRDFIISGDNEVVPKGRPFVKHIGGNAEVAGLKKRHCRFAKTMKARQVESTDDYTAYIWNDGKTLTVYYYNTECTKLAG